MGAAAFVRLPATPAVRSPVRAPLRRDVLAAELVREPAGAWVASRRSRREAGASASSAGAGIPGPWKRCVVWGRRDGVSSVAVALVEPLLTGA